MRGNPLLLYSDVFFNKLNQLFSIEVRQCNLTGRMLKSHHVAFGPEHSDFTFGVSIGFEAFVALNRIMEGRVERVEL